MAFILTETHKLNAYTFVIPSYQRGYRWDRDQVEALLNDLKDFLATNPGPNDAYYLQPIVVAPLANNTYEVIDGQQRLTTLYLILQCLNALNPWSAITPYELTFSNRPVQDRFIKNKDYQNPNADYASNIDTFYMHKAYEIIESWMKENFKGNMELMSKFSDLLTSNKKGPWVKVIWYELSGKDAIATFRDINYGRIPLTGTELVKALLLADEGNASDTTNRANAWDRMEKSLQDPAFWSMLNVSVSSLSHIDFILDMVADELKGDRTRDRDKSLFNYRVIDAYLRAHNSKDQVWRMMEETYNRIRNWYDNPQWYNLIGLRSRLGKFGEANIRAIERAAASKADMTEALRREIGTMLKKCDLRNDEEKAQNLHPLQAQAFDYQYNPDQIRKILLAFNVWTLMNHTSQQRFPFNLYDLYNETSLEHIHPQNITSDLRYCDVKEWATIRMANALELRPDDASLKEIAERLTEALTAPIWDKDSKVNESGAEWTAISADVAAIDKIFGDMAQIDIKELHSIANMALVDQPTNSALSNHYLDAKRRILHERNDLRLSKGDDTKKIDNAMYLMPATEMAFSKFFTKRHLLGDMRFWRKEDRKDYLEAITQAYDYFTR